MQLWGVNMALYILLRYIGNFLPAKKQPDLNIKYPMKFEGYGAKGYKVLDIS